MYGVNYIGNDRLGEFILEDWVGKPPMLRDFDSIKKKVLEKYDVDEISFEKYYYDFINSLNQNQLLED